MRLLKVMEQGVELHDPVAGSGFEHRGLYVDAGTGQVYALTDEARDGLDPLWRGEVPEST
jgi:hypothetical protein